MIALLLAALAAQTGGSDIVVTAKAQADERRIARQIDAVLPPMTFDQPLARFTTPVCPGVFGLLGATAQAVVDRIGVIADDVGLKVGEPGCDPNLLVIVTTDGRATVKRIVSRRQGNVRAQTLADIRRIVAEPGTARAWVEAEVRSRDGEPLFFPPDGPPVLAVQGPSRAMLNFRRDIASAIIVIDTAAMTSRDVNQIADYAAMRGLTDARPGRLPAGATILSAFTPDGDAIAPKALTALDRGILHGLYDGLGNIPSTMKRASMARDVMRRDGSP